MTEAESSLPSPRQLGVMIVNGMYDSEKNNLDECIDELLLYMPEAYPRRTVELQIKDIILNQKSRSKKKKKKKSKGSKNKISQK